MPILHWLLPLLVSCTQTVPDEEVVPPTAPIDKEPLKLIGEPRKGKNPNPQRKGKGQEPPIDELEQISIGARSSWLHVPKDLQEGEKVPLVLMFHGGGNNGLGGSTLWEDQFDRKLLIAFPNGQEDNPEFSGWFPISGDPHEHIPFIESLVDELIAKYPVDKDRVYATGFSDGAAMTLRLACFSDRFAGFMVVAAAMQENVIAMCDAPHPASMMFVIGTEDPKTPPDGHEPGRQDGSPRVGTEATLDFWLAKNGCKKETEVSRMLPDLASDGTRVRERTFTDCKRAAVRYLDVQGGRHSWPSKMLPAPGRCSDVEGSEIALEWWQKTQKIPEIPATP